MEEYKDGYVTECTYCSGSSSSGAGFLFGHKSGLQEDIVKKVKELEKMDESF